MSDKRYLLLIHPDTSIEHVIVKDVSPDFQSLIGGKLFAVKPGLIKLTDVTLVIDEEAQSNGRPFNSFATFLRGYSDQPIFGTCAITKTTLNTLGLRSFNPDSFRVICEFVERLRSYFLNLDTLVLNKVIKS